MDVEMKEKNRNEQPLLKEPKKKEPKVVNRGEATLEPTAKLLRFLYIGNDKNVFISQRCCPISIDNLDDRLNFIKDMAALRYSLPFGIIKKVMLSNTLRRNDEALLAISYCLRRVNNIAALDVVKLKTEIYKSLPELLRTDSDMFLFVHLSNKILNDVDANEKTSFGRGMKKALYQWYENRTAEELANIFGRNRGMYGWYGSNLQNRPAFFSNKKLIFRTHRDIIHMCHIKFGSADMNDKAKLVATLFKRGSETITELKELQSTVSDETWSKAIRRMYQICSLKVNESAADAAEMIQLHDFEVGHLPAHLISHHQIWDILIPKMNYRELLNVFQTLHTLNMLNPTDPLATKMGSSLGNGELIKASGMHPLEIYRVLKSYQKNERYNETIKVCSISN